MFWWDYLREFIIYTFSLWLWALFERRVYSRESIFQGNKLCKFLILTCLPLVALKSPHLNVHDFTEKTKTFYCPSGYEFSTKSKVLQQETKRVCSLKSRCSWTMSNGCSGWENGSMGKWIMDRYFEVIIINLYSSEQKFNLWTISTKIYTIYHVCGYCDCVQPYKP